MTTDEVFHSLTGFRERARDQGWVRTLLGGAPDARKVAELTKLVGNVAAGTCHSGAPSWGVVLRVALGAWCWIESEGYYRGQIVQMVRNERARQREQLGSNPNTTPEQWLTALVEELGEVAEASLQWPHRLVAELVQVCAVAVWWAETLSEGAVPAQAAA